MNPNAKAHFEQNPEARYWYYSPTLRVPNPRISKAPGYVPDPWRDEEGTA